MSTLSPGASRVKTRTLLICLETEPPLRPSTTAEAGSAIKIEGVPVVAKPWVVSDELWERAEPLLPKVERRFRYPGRKRLPDRQALQGILFVLHTGIAWRHLPLELVFGGGSTCYRRLHHFKRLLVRYDRRHEIHEAFLRLACCLVCFKRLPGSP